MRRRSGAAPCASSIGAISNRPSAPRANRRDVFLAAVTAMFQSKGKRRRQTTDFAQEIFGLARMARNNPSTNWLKNARSGAKCVLPGDCRYLTFCLRKSATISNTRFPICGGFEHETSIHLMCVAHPAGSSWSAEICCCSFDDRDLQSGHILQAQLPMRVHEYLRVLHWRGRERWRKWTTQGRWPNLGSR